MGEHVDAQFSHDDLGVFMHLDALKAALADRHAMMCVRPQIRLDARKLVKNRSTNILLKMDDLI